MPQFSVIIPNYNHSRFLERRIVSVLEQDFTDYELILLDDTSTDNSRDIIEKFRGHNKISHIVYSSRNSGSPFKQWKKGIELAQAEWVWIAESDDDADPLFLEEADKLIRQHPSTGLFYTDSFIIDENGQKREPDKYSQIKNKFLDTDKWNKPYHHSGIIEINDCLKYFCSVNNVSSAVMKKELLFSFLEELASYQKHGDWFCYLELAAKAPVTYTPSPLSLVRNHTASYLNSNKDAIKSKTEYFRLLLLLLNQKNITDKKKIIHFFAEQYLSFGIRKDGGGRISQLLHVYLKQNISTALKVLWHIFIIKITRKKITSVF